MYRRLDSSGRPVAEGPGRPPADSPFVRSRHACPLPEAPELACCEPGAAVLDLPPPGPTSAVSLPQVPGARLLRNVCSAAECAQLLLLAEAAGLQDEEEEAGGGGVQRAAFFVDDQLNQSLTERVQPFLPQESLGGPFSGLDRLWIVERCVTGTRSRPRLQRPRGGCCWADGRLTQTAEQVSRATLLLFLNRGVRGGELRFWVPDQRLEAFEHFGLPPEQGSAVFFFHGDHPLSVVHEDAPVLSGARHVLKCSVLYRKHLHEGQTEEFEQCVRDYPNIYHGRKRWEQWIRGLAAPGAPRGEPLERILEMLRPSGISPAEPWLGSSQPVSSQLQLGAPIEGVVPLASADGDVQEYSYSIGELVEAFWAPEGAFFKARVSHIKDSSAVTVKWTAWEGSATLPVNNVRRCTTTSSKPPEPEAEWVVID